MMSFIITVVVLGLIVFFVVSQYNALVTKRNAFKNAFAQIDVQLQRRFDLIPNLVETVKGYMKHEQETLQQVIEARNMAQSALKDARASAGDASPDAIRMKKLGASEGMLEGALSRLMVVVEAYPDLKASQNMMQLTEELSTTENKVAFARQSYNDSVMSYNNKRETFPTNIMANMFGFQEATLLTIPEEKQEQVRAAPTVTF